jgi:hypothetical protein
VSRKQTPASRAEMRLRLRIAAEAARLDAWLDTQPGVTEEVRRAAHRRLKAAAANDTKRHGKWGRAMEAAKAEAGTREA